MTWGELAEKIAAMNTEQRGTDVTFFDSNDGEFGAIVGLRFTDEKETDQLDHNHPYLYGWE